MIPGSPSTPDMPVRRRVLFGLVSVLLGLTGSLGTALVTVNLFQIQGELGLTPVEGAWLTSAYLMTNIAMNLLLVKYRQQFGVSSFVKVFLSLYALAAVAELLVHSFPTGVAVRAFSGVAGAALSGMTVFYAMQTLPAKMKIQSLLIGIGITQLGIPIARVISPMMIDLGGWQTLGALEAALALASVVAVHLVAIPHGMRIHAFEPADILSFLLLASGLALFVAVLSLGRLEWWFERPWLGIAAASGVALVTIGWIHEHRRANPLIDTWWFTSASYVRFAVSILFVRMLLSEQPVGTTGLLQALNMAPEQLRHLYATVAVATLAGTLVGAFSLMISPKLVLAQSFATLTLIALGSWMDAHATVQTHPANLFLSQALVSFAAAMFMGVVVMQGLDHLMRRGFGSIITFVVTFSLTQVLGGLLGGAILSTFQTLRSAHHAAYLAEALTATNPQAAMTIQTYVGAYASTIADPAARTTQGLSVVAQQVLQQANILAFNDVFFLIFWIALAQLVLTAAFTGRSLWQARRQATASATAPPDDVRTAGAVV